MCPMCFDSLSHTHTHSLSLSFTHTQTVLRQRGHSQVTFCMTTLTFEPEHAKFRSLKRLVFLHVCIYSGTPLRWTLWDCCILFVIARCPLWRGCNTIQYFMSLSKSEIISGYRNNRSLPPSLPALSLSLEGFCNSLRLCIVLSTTLLSNTIYSPFVCFVPT